MSAALQLLAALRERKIEPVCHDGRLKLRGPAAQITSELVEKVRRHKADLLAYLRAEQASEPERLRWPEHPRPPMLLRRCSALICQTCHVHSPSPHREGCAFLRFDVCRSRWFWLSPHGAIKCVVCASPVDLGLVEGWVLARETGEGDDGYRIPGEILSLLHVASPLQ